MLIKKWHPDCLKIVKDIALQYPSLKINDIYQRKNIQNENEIVIELFPMYPIDYKDLTRINTTYLKECHQMFDNINDKFNNYCQSDINKRNNWAYIYIKL